MVYSREIDGKRYTFGVSGRLYKSNVLLYDHQSESLWSQLMSKAIAGPLVQTQLQPLPALRTSWGAWRRQHPQTRVLSTATGYDRDYQLDPYEGYYKLGSIWFPVGDVRRDLSPKTQILGIVVNQTAKAYSLDMLNTRPGIVEDRIGSHTIQIEVSPDGEIVAVRSPQGEPLTHIFAYWFAWQAFHPHTGVYGQSQGS